MVINVTKDNVTITNKAQVHKGEYNVNTLEFEFSEEYSEISKMAVFSTPIDVYEVPITNNTCIIPHEVLTQRGTLTIGVYGYTVEDEVINKRYSPNPVTIPIDNGSYISGASNAQEQEPTLFEEFVEQIEAGFDEVADDITALDNSKQDKLTAGTNITIENNVISSTAEVNAIDKIKVNNVEQPIVNKTVNISVPTKTSDISNDSGFITKEVDDLTNYELKTNTGHSIDMTIDTDYVLSVSLKNSAGNVLNSKSVDLPLETMIVNGSYDSATKEVVLILDNGNEIRFSVADLVSGLQTEITSDNKLASDLVDDTNQTNKFVTTSDKNTWNNKQNAITNDNKLNADYIATSTGKQFVSDTEKQTWNNKSDFTGNYEDLTNKPDLTIYEEKTDAQAKYEQLQAENEALLDQIPTATAEGETIHVEDSSDLPIKEIDLLGNAIQDGTPTPDTPQDIHVVTGDNTLQVVGKNLAGEISRVAIGNSEASPTGQQLLIGGTNYRGCVVRVVSGTTISISRGDTTSNSRFRYGFVKIVENNAPVYNYTSKDSELKVENITVPSEMQYLIVYLSNTGQTTNNFQVEIGSTATTYEPYQAKTQTIHLGTIELAKIGDYTDKIFKDNGKWYLEKNIEKIENYNGETIDTSYISSTGGLDIGATVYYQLTTPTITEITDETLIAQLENVLKMHTNKNVTNGWIEPTGTNAQAGMVLVYRQDIQTLITNNTNAILSLGGNV